MLSAFGVDHGFEVSKLERETKHGAKVGATWGAGLGATGAALRAPAVLSGMHGSPALKAGVATGGILGGAALHGGLGAGLGAAVGATQASNRKARRRKR